MVTPLQRDGVKIPNGTSLFANARMRGNIATCDSLGKSGGPGSVMLELAREGQWPAPADPKGRYVAGPNGTGWQAISLGETAPAEWTVATVDLWKDIGDFSLTGCAPNATAGMKRGSIRSCWLRPISALDAYRPEATSSEDAKPIGDASPTRAIRSDEFFVESGWICGRSVARRYGRVNRVTWPVLSIGGWASVWIRRVSNLCPRPIDARSCGG